jgi:F0F1-type ATP synthase gamma subunit
MVKGKQIFKPQFKMFSIFIMILGIVQIISASNFKKNSNKITITENYLNKNNSEIKEIILQNNFTFDINMLVKYSVDQTEYIPIESSSSLTGFVSGYVWEFKSIQTDNYKKGQKAKYIANGILKWNLFGINIYTELKSFSGTIE